MIHQTVILTSLFIVIGFISYVFMNNKTKINLYLIEKGLDAKLIKSTYDYSLIYHLGTILIGFGLGVFTGGFLIKRYGLVNEVTYVGSVTTFMGISILAGFIFKKYFIKNI